jgi:membrane protease YdiL (CAAX protease family)
MLSTSSVAPPPRIASDTRVRSFVIVVVGTVLFLTIVGVVAKGLRWLLQGHVAETLRSRTALTISGSALGEFAVLILLILFLRMRGRSLRDLGIWQRSPLRGWILAALMTGLYVWVVFTSVLRNQSGMGEVSLFHIFTSLAAGLSAGIVEEAFFRGFIMNQLKWSGFGPAVQVVISGVCFGVAHVGWGLLAAKPQVNMAVGAMVTTSFLGILYGLCYLSSRRSLLPVIVGHALMDILIEPWLIMTTLGAATAHLR